VLGQPTARTVVLLEGINDIAGGGAEGAVGAADIITAYRELVGRAHAAGLRILAGTLTPFEGSDMYGAAPAAPCCQRLAKAHGRLGRFL
jgi:hypothetical protein